MVANILHSLPTSYNIFRKQYDWIRTKDDDKKPVVSFSMLSIMMVSSSSIKQSTQLHRAQDALLPSSDKLCLCARNRDRRSPRSMAKFASFVSMHHHPKADLETTVADCLFR